MTENHTRRESCSKTACPASFSQKSKHNRLSPVVKKNLQGSLSIEAAAVLPLFMMFCAALISFIMLCGTQMNVQVRMEEAARIFGKTAYLMEHADALAGRENPAVAGGKSNSGNTDTGAGNTGTGGKNTISAQEYSLANAGINSATIKLLMSGNGFSQLADHSRIRGGMSGLYTHESSYDHDSGILDIVVNYDYSFPWIPEPIGRLRFIQRMRSHAWVGTSLTAMPGGIGNTANHDQNTVYVTPTGSVYHLDPSCHYLDLSIHAASYDNLSNERNVSGAKYDRCPLCGRDGAGDVVYITDYGTSWHTSLSCSGLKRTIMEKDISDVEGMRLCTKCREGSHNHEE